MKEEMLDCKFYVTVHSLSSLVDSDVRFFQRFRCETGGLQWCRQCDQGSMLWSQFSAIFRQFSAKNWRYSQKTINDRFLHNIAMFRVKNAIFSQNFRRKSFKYHNIGPRLDKISPIGRLTSSSSFFFENHRSRPHVRAPFSTVNYALLLT
jgi:hypothetical protein